MFQGRYTHASAVGKNSHMWSEHEGHRGFPLYARYCIPTTPAPSFWCQPAQICGSYKILSRGFHNHHSYEQIS
jgi:hypothetical protein